MQNGNEIVFLVTIGVLSMLILVAALIIFVVIYYRKISEKYFEMEKFKRLQSEERLNNISQTRESERQRISANLHDSVGANLSIVSLLLDRLQMETDSYDNPLLLEAKNQLKDSISEIRNIVLDLSPATLERFGFAEAIKEICERIHSSGLIKVKFENSCPEHKFSDNIQQITTYRIVQELISNAVKHSGSTEIHVLIKKTEDVLQITVKDFGKGLDDNYKNCKKGFGLKNIETATTLINADLIMSKHDQGGLVAILTVPLNNNKN